MARSAMDGGRSATDGRSSSKVAATNELSTCSSSSSSDSGSVSIPMVARGPRRLSRPGLVWEEVTDDEDDAREEATRGDEATEAVLDDEEEGARGEEV